MWPSLGRRKASVEPSGDQRGAPSCGPLVMRRGGESPSVATSQRLVSYPSCFAFTVTSTYAARRPSGAICGLATQRNANRSLSERDNESGAHAISDLPARAPWGGDRRSAAP